MTNFNKKEFKELNSKLNTISEKIQKFAFDKTMCKIRQGQGLPGIHGFAGVSKIIVDCNMIEEYSLKCEILEQAEWLTNIAKAIKLPE